MPVRDLKKNCPEEKKILSSMLNKSFKKIMSKAISKNHFPSSLTFFPILDHLQLLMNYNFYFPMKVKGITGHFFVCMPRDCLWS